jgi:steroid 5-alpha reductase family enzyme
MRELALANAAGQVLLFIIAVNIPAWKTGRLSYVDIGWPLGVALVGALTLAIADGHPVRKAAVSGAYLLVGLRMGLGALKLWRMGHLREELPRYRYQRLRWERKGMQNERLMIQIDASLQGLANLSFLAFPAFVIAANPAPELHILEMLGLLLWACALVMESLADYQKLAFLRAMKSAGKKHQVCNVGLWRYTRHPNYFAEWMVWNGLMVAALPSWWARQALDPVLLWLLLGLGLLFVSRIMYSTLVYFTGAKPAEYYSVQRRPAYRTYQQTTNMFFPGRFRPVEDDAQSSD